MAFLTTTTALVGTLGLSLSSFHVSDAFVPSMIQCQAFIAHAAAKPDDNVTVIGSTKDKLDVKFDKGGVTLYLSLIHI